VWKNSGLAVEKVCGVYAWERARPWYIHSSVQYHWWFYSSRCTLVCVFGCVREAIHKARCRSSTTLLGVALLFHPVQGVLVRVWYAHTIHT